MMNKTLTMKEVCQKTGLGYETLKYYSRQGLIPDQKRDENNHRIYTEEDVDWIDHIITLRDCSLSIAEIRKYLNLVLQEETTVQTRRDIMIEQKKRLEKRIAQDQKTLEAVEKRIERLQDILDGRIPYVNTFSHHTFHFSEKEDQ